MDRTGLATLVVSLLAVAMWLASGAVVEGEETRQGAPDPLVFGTFLGGSATDWAHSVAIGPTGSVYVAGYTLSADFPTTDGAFSRVNKGQEDIYVARLSADGSELIWATLIGGSGQDIPWDMSLGTGGEVYLVGYTSSSDLPTTGDAYSRQLDGASDGFVIRLAADGGSLEYSTFLGGEGDDQAYSMVTLADGTAYVAGHTESTFFPTTAGAHDRAKGGASDVFLVRLSNDLRRLEASTYLGGGYTEWEPQLARDDRGNLWVAGSTTSLDFPTSTWAYQREAGSGRDIFVASMGPDLDGIRVSTLLGEEGNDVPRSIGLTDGGGVLVGGLSNSPTFPGPEGAPDRTSSGKTDGFLVQFDIQLSYLSASVLYGGSNFDVVRAARLDSYNNLHVVGYTNSTDFPTTAGSYKPAKAGDDHDMFYMLLDGDHFSPFNSTFIGKAMGDFGMDLALDDNGLPVIVGHTRSADFPTAGTPQDPTYNGEGDAAVLGFNLDQDPPEFGSDLTPRVVRAGENLTFRVHVSDVMGLQRVLVYYNPQFDDYSGARTAIMEGEGIYEATIKVSPRTLGLRYQFEAWDVLGRFSRTETFSIEVIDAIPPELVSDGTPDQATTGDPLEFALHVRDNWQVRAAHVEYSVGDQETNASMDVAFIGGINEHWNLTIPMAPDRLSPVRYRFTFCDWSGNWASTALKVVPVMDDDPPVVGAPSVPSRAQPGTTLTINASVADNIGVDSVRVEHGVEMGAFETITVTPPFGSRVEVEVPVPDGRGDLHVVVIAVDAAGNTGQVSLVIPYADDQPPRIFNINTSGVASTGDDFLVYWEAEDPAGIQSLWASYVFGEGRDLSEYTYLPSDTTDYGSAWIAVPPDSVEPLFVRYGATDLYSNLNVTAPIHFDVVDDDPPVAHAGEDQVVIEGSEYLHSGFSNDNVGIVRYEWSVRMPDGRFIANVSQAPFLEIDGELRRGEYIYSITVFDAAGNSDTDTVTITIVREREEPEDRDLRLHLVLAAVGVAAIAVAITVIALQRRGDR